MISKHSSASPKGRIDYRAEMVQELMWSISGSLDQIDVLTEEYGASWEHVAQLDAIVATLTKATNDINEFAKSVKPSAS